MDRNALSDHAVGEYQIRPYTGALFLQCPAPSILVTFIKDIPMAEPLTILIVHAHPDDEAISTGGTLARYSAEGIRTVLVTATLGEEGEIVDPELNTPEVKARLSEVRLGELHEAVAILNVGTLEILG